VVSSYVLNLAALLALHGATQAWDMSDLRTCVAFNSKVVEGRKLAGVEDEAALVARILSQPEGMVTPTKSAQEALDVLHSSHIFHYAGYGRRSHRNLTDSAFRLDSELKICDIIHTPLRHPVLAYLSRWPVALDRELGSATGMLLSGFKSIVTTMWYVTKSTPLGVCAYHPLHRHLTDKDGAVLAEAFYRSWLANGRDGLVSLQDIPYALDDACTALRAAGRDPTRKRWGALAHIGA
jgi:hypothetical protein